MRVHPSFDSARTSQRRSEKEFRQSQAGIIKSPNVIGLALRNKPTLREFAILTGNEDVVAWLAEAIQIRPLGSSELLQLTLRGQSAREVTTVLGEVLNAYEESVWRTDMATRIESLNKTIRTRRNDLDKLTTEYRDMCESRKFPTAPYQNHGAPVPLVEHVTRQLAAIRGELAQMANELAEVQSNPAEQSSIPVVLVRDRIAKDPELVELRIEKSEFEDEMKRIEDQFGSDASQLQEYQREIARIEQEMADLAETIRPNVERVMLAEADDSPSLDASQVTVLGTRIASLLEQFVHVENAVVEIKRRKALTEKLDEIERQQAILDESQRQMAFLEFEVDQPRPVVIETYPDIRNENIKLRVITVLASFVLTFCLTSGLVALVGDRMRRRDNLGES